MGMIKSLLSALEGNMSILYPHAARCANNNNFFPYNVQAASMPSLLVGTRR